MGANGGAMEHGERHQECIRQVHMTEPGPPGVSVNYSPFYFQVARGRKINNPTPEECT